MSGNLFPGGALFYGFTSCRCESVGRIIGIIDGGCGGFIGFAHRDGGSGMSGCDFCLPFLFGRSLAGLEGKGGVCFSGGGNARRPVLLEERFGGRSSVGMELFVGDAGRCSPDGTWTGCFSGRIYGLSGRLAGGASGGKWERLAGNVRHPFNEYLRIAVEYGVAGLLLVAGVIWLLWRWYRRCRPEDRPLYRSIGGAGICGLFSYPLNYPAVCVLLVLLLGVIVRGRPVCFYGGRWFKTGIGALAVAVLAVTLYWNRAEREWHRISCLSLNGRTEEVLTDYARLYPFMRENPLFLYNYGAELHVAGLWTASLSILTECVRGLNDTDVQMLLADNYSRLGEYDRAERHYRRAARMCPNRFMPLYRLVKLYGQTGRDAEARQLAGEIIVKPVKVPSFRVDRMKREMEKYLRKP